jgi:hypothetical protein
VVERHIFLLKSLTNCDAMVWREGIARHAIRFFLVFARLASRR